ncbi:MAG: transposase [Isosphaeraceae bacterium]
MPTYARGQIIVEDMVGVYHCIARCVRRAFLCGIDSYTGQDYSHRKEWILDRLRELAGLFAIEVCGYSVMSNHLHLVLRNRPDIAEQWSADEIAWRWCRVFPPRDDATGEPREPDLAMLTANSERLAEVRKRLANLSWFMRCFCEKIARKANHEDGSRGRFWAGRFRSVALLDEAAILACSVYVDLNPIRAGIATTPEESSYTSGRDRIRGMLDTSSRLASNDQESPLEAGERPDGWLCERTLQETASEPASTTAVGTASPRHESASQAGPVATAVADAVAGSQASADSSPISGVAVPVAAPRRPHARASDQGFLPIQVEHYVMLLDSTGRELRADKRGAIPDHLAPIMERLGLNRSNWVETVRGFGRLFKQAAGRSSSLVDAAARRSRRWFQGKAAARTAFV